MRTCIAAAALIAATVGATQPSGTPLRAAGLRTADASMTPGATSVLDYGADNTGVADSTAAFLSAQDAALASDARYADGPTGDPQAVVYVPPGTYRLLRLHFRSNVRMEVSSGAVLEQAGGPDVPATPEKVALIIWDGPGATALSNVSLVGIADSDAGPKSLAQPLFPGWSVDSDFTFDLDPAATDASSIVTGLLMYNVSGFLVQNVFSIENDSQPTVAVQAKGDWWPQSRKAALSLAERADTPADGSVFYDPHDGTVTNWYNVGAPKGFGPNQVNAGHDLTFAHIFSRGGTALRLETDGSQGKTFAAELRGVTADDIAGDDCNRAVAFAPHEQNNYDVHVSNVQAVSCAQGVIESIDTTRNGPQGAFYDSTIANVNVTAGPDAQVGVPGTNGGWLSGESTQAFAKDLASRAKWAVVYTAGTYKCSGVFAQASTKIMTTIGLRKPTCR